MRSLWGMEAEQLLAVLYHEMLFIVAEKEELLSNRENGIKAYERARGPKKLVTIPNITHYGVYREARAQAQQLAVAWFDAHLKGERPPEEPKK